MKGLNILQIDPLGRQGFLLIDHQLLCTDCTLSSLNLKYQRLFVNCDQKQKQKLYISVCPNKGPPLKKTGISRVNY